MVSAIQLVSIFVIPFFILLLRNTKFVRFIGTIGVAYLAGIIVAVGVFFINKTGAAIELNSDIGEIGSHAAIAIGIPLLLFGANLKATKQLSKKVLKAFLILILSVIFVTVICFFAFKGSLEYSAELSGMAIGLYTGGTPNLNAIGSILRVPAEVIALANLSDMMIGGVFYMFLLIACKPILKRILTSPIDDEIYINGEVRVENVDDFKIVKYKKKPLVIVLLVALGCAIVGAIVGLLFWILMGSVQGEMTNYLVPWMMIVVTILGIVFSFNKKIREVEGSNILGHYCILVFSFALSMSLDISKFNSALVYTLLLYGIITLGTFVVHTVFCKIFKIDYACSMVTLTAGLYGPAFIPAITRQIKRDSLTPAGLICGSLGYAVGTFLGLGVAILLGLMI